MSQTAKIREHLESGKAITPVQALRLYGCFRLGARIWDLKQEGMNIESELVKTRNGATVAQYKLSGGN